MSSYNAEIIRKLKEARDKWFPKILIESKKAGFQISRFGEGAWHVVEDLQDSQNIFEQRVLLIPDSMTLFKLREFPAGAVSRQTLAEAVELDLARWSPWVEDNECYFWPKLCGDKWQVAVWVWQGEELTKLRKSLVSTPTHVLPARAWKIASLEIAPANFVHIDKEIDGSWVYTGMGEDFSSLTVTGVRSEADANRFRLGLARRSRGLATCIDLQSLDDVPEWEDKAIVTASNFTLPESSALAVARQPGISDWSDPFVWAKPTGALLSIYVLWLLGSGLVLVKQGQEIQDLSSRAGSVSNEVLDARAEVERVNQLLEQVDRIRANQLELEALLASLSKSLPKNGWLEHIEYRGDDDDGGWLELTGKSDQSTELAAILEQMPEVEQAMFLTDIRRDARTGLEPFKIRLKLRLDSNSG